MDCQKIALALLCCLCFFEQTAAQSLKALEKAGDKAFAQKDYYAAFIHYRDALLLDPEAVNIWFKYAEVTRQFNAHEEAENYYTKVCRSQEAGQFPMATFWLGQMKKSLTKYDEAGEVFDKFLKNSPAMDYYSDWARRELDNCRWAKSLTPPAGQKITIDHLDKKINSPYSEFGAYDAAGTLYYSSYRFEFPGDKHLPARKLSKVMTSEKEAKGKPLPKTFNTADKHTAHTSFALNGNRIYFTICEFVTSSDIRCELFFREKDKKGRWEKEAKKLPASINLKGFTATQPAIGFDSVTQKEVLFFVSDRPGGKGKLDIWFSKMNGDKFGEPKNLEAANTPENDITPFFLDRQQALFFSSEGHDGLGSYDIFRIAKKTEWGNVTNPGAPVNSSYHDIYYSVNPAATVGYLSSNRPGSFYLDASNKACCYDIYRVTYEELPSEKPGDPPLLPPPPVEVPPPFFPTKLEDFLPLALYFDNDEPDKRTQRPTTKKTYSSTYDQYFERRNTYLKEYTKPLKEEDVNDVMLTIEAFFDEEVQKGFDHLQLFSAILLQRLENGERVEIVIKGYTSPRAQSDYNDRLAQRRISSLRNHFEDWRDGIFKPYLASGKLVLSEAPFGETKAASGISDELTDERNSIYSVGAAKERRVEIVEVK